MAALQFAACTRNGKAVILIVIASNTHIQDPGKNWKTIVWKLYGPFWNLIRKYFVHLNWIILALPIPVGSIAQLVEQRSRNPKM